MGPAFEKGQRVVYRGHEAAIAGQEGTVQSVLGDTAGPGRVGGIRRVGSGLRVALDSGQYVIRPASDWRAAGPVNWQHELSQLEALVADTPFLALSGLEQLLQDAGFDALADLVAAAHGDTD
jgi:hypothetical protein